jgi:hypothetical protein
LSIQINQFATNWKKLTIHSAYKAACTGTSKHPFPTPHGKQVSLTATISYQNKPWLANCQPGVPQSVTCEKAFHPDFLERSVQRFSDTMALLFQGHRVSYRQRDEMINHGTVRAEGPRFFCSQPCTWGRLAMRWPSLPRKTPGAGSSFSIPIPKK